MPDVGPKLRTGIWLAALLVVATLGFLRVAIDVEYAFISAVILPVVTVAWIGGYRQGVIFSVLASAMWAGAELLSGREFSAPWVPLLNGLTRCVVYGLIAFLTASVRTLMLREQRLARHDTLTDLFNRRAFYEIGQDETERARRYGHALAIAFLDLDNFKQLNDTRGHEAGDRALKAVAAAMTRSLRTTDRIARLGGDEFAILIPEGDYEAATEAGHKLAGEINQALRSFLPVSVSIGVAWFESATGDFAEMVKAADSLMYEIKEAGKHGVRSKRFPASLAQ